MIRRSLLASCAFLAASALNPGYLVGCVMGDDDDPGFEYGADDLAALLKEANGTHFVKKDGVEWRIDLSVAPATKPTSANLGPGVWSATAHACGNRTLYTSAQACVDSSSMPVIGTVKLVGHDAEASHVIKSGELTVLGLKLTSAQLYLRAGDAAVALSSSDGQTFDTVQLSWPQ